MIETQVKNCWDHIGVGGDRTCEELKQMTHCRNCPVYAAAGRRLLDREASIDYLNEWTTVLAKPQPEAAKHHRHHYGSINEPVDNCDANSETISVMIVRLTSECLALPVRSLQEVTHPCILHTLPHRTNHLFLGLVNIRGEILLCISLKYLLDLENSNRGNSGSKTPNLKTANLRNTNLRNNGEPEPVYKTPAHKTAAQMVVIAQEENRWVFTVDEVCGFHRFPASELQAAPVVTKTTTTYTQGIFEWQGHPVNLLDLDLLFYTLKRRIL